MTEAEVLSLRLETLTFILSLFATFFTIISAYIAGLFFFLRRAGFALKALAFFLLTMGLAFLGGLAIGVTDVVEVVILAWERLQVPIEQDQSFRSWIAQLGSSFEWYHMGALLGWAVAAAVYLALFYMTFLHRWRVAPVRGPSESSLRSEEFAA